MPTDGELLSQWAERRSEESFAELVRRHGPMVLASCRRLAGQEAEDAAQATFILLARKAGKLSGQDEIGPWLHRACGFVARAMRRERARRALREREAAPMLEAARSAGTPDGASREEVDRHLDAALSELPERFRRVVVLCHLEGATQEAAARRLGVPLSTVANRVARGLEKLREKLSRRKVELSAAALGALLLEGSARAAEAFAASQLLPSALAASKLAVTGTAAGAGGLSWSLAEGAARMMWWAKFKAVCAALGAAAIMGATVTGMVLAHGAEGSAVPAPPPHAGPADARPASPVARPEPAAAKSPEAIAKECFPDDGVLMTVTLASFNPVSYGPVTGCELRFNVESVIRLEKGKAEGGGPKVPMNPFTLEQTLQLLDQTKKDRVVLWKNERMKQDPYAAALAAEGNRLKDRLKAGQTYLLVLPSALQLCPAPPLPVPGLPWCQIDPAGLVLTDFGEKAAQDLPRRLKAVGDDLSELTGPDRAKRAAAMKSLADNCDLSERLLVRETASGEAGRRLAAALALAEMGSPRAVAPLTAALDDPEPASCREVIRAFVGFKGWSIPAARKLAAKLDDTAERSAGGEKFTLADTAAAALKTLTGKDFGQDKAKWIEWLDSVERERNQPQPPGGATFGRG